MSSILLHDIGRLVTPLSQHKDDSARPLLTIERAAVWLENGAFKQVGTSADLLHSVPSNIERISAGGKMMLPGFVDCHAHPLFIGNRAHEFFLRNRGASYQEIAAAGGGIHATAERIARACEHHIVREALPRFERSLEFGVTTIEVKSGYGLTWEGELKLLHSMRELKPLLPQRMSRTFLVHVVPSSWQDRRKLFVESVIEEMIPEVAGRRMADCIDVFCEEGAFTVDESRRILRAAQDERLDVTIHANQFGHSGGALLAAELGARSADHLEYLNDDEIAALLQAEVPAVALPACVFFMGTIPYPPLRKMIDAGLRVALATDMNLGTAMTESIPFCMTAAAIYGKMSANELLWAVTLDPARILNLDAVTGSIEAGKSADFSLWNLPELETLPYFFGHAVAEEVWVAGEHVFESQAVVHRY
ncbi:MAG: imidazolonepropionase [bacterium]|nr:imidazolonepropionase [bacterium]